MTNVEPHEEPVFRAIDALKSGETPDEKCYFCGGTIHVVGAPPEGPPYTAFLFTCPCKRTSGHLHGL